MLLYAVINYYNKLKFLSKTILMSYNMYFVFSRQANDEVI